MGESERVLLQVRITDDQRRRIKAMAASQGMTLQEALTASFTAWERELKAGKGAGKTK